MLTLCVSAPKAVSANMAGTIDSLETHTIDKNILNHLDLGVNAGTTGLGLTLSLPIGNAVRLRTGVDYTPRTQIPMRFELMSYLPGESEASSSAEAERFDRLSALMESFTGMGVDRYIDTHAKGTMVNFKLLVDVYPFRNNKHWYATAGFYWGSSKVGHAENTIQEAPSIVGVIMYNKLYDFFANERYLNEPLIDPSLVGGTDAYIDPAVGDQMRDKFLSYGRVGAKNGYFIEGSPFAGQPYMMTPDESGTVFADMFVNNFKPYVGLGFNTSLSKDKRWSFSVDAGAMFWGRPKVLTHERYILDAGGNTVSYGIIADSDVDLYTYGGRVDIANDVERVVGKLGDYVEICRSLKVYPVLNLKISYKLF